MTGNDDAAPGEDGAAKALHGKAQRGSCLDGPRIYAYPKLPAGYGHD